MTRVPELTAVPRVFVRVVLTVVVSVAHPALRDAVARVALEAAGLTRMASHWGTNGQRRRLGDAEDGGDVFVRKQRASPPVQLASSDQSLQSLSPSQRHASRMQTPRAHVNSPGPHWWDSEDVFKWLLITGPLKKHLFVSFPTWNGFMFKLFNGAQQPLVDEVNITTTNTREK